ncbi:MAG TPA: class I SAM-dependent methyltransferase [Blastocatellia bacterium]|nr:class I SAM-dependent methyltransferase [Blastocatellia bacterium]
MIATVDKIRNDFDRIARLTAQDAIHPSPYRTFLLEQIPRSLPRVLEVGCGTGGFSRALAERGHQVTSIDLSPEMIRVAGEQASPSQCVSFICGDFMRDSFGNEAFDCVVSIATLHHLDLEAAVRRMAGLVGPGGLLVVHDLRSDAGMWDRVRSVFGVAARAWAAMVGGGQLWERAEVRAAWAAHGLGERYLTMREVECWAQALLPGSRCVRHLQWRYTVVWRRAA